MLVIIAPAIDPLVNLTFLLILIGLNVNTFKNNYKPYVSLKHITNPEQYHQHPIKIYQYVATEYADDLTLIEKEDEQTQRPAVYFEIISIHAGREKKHIKLANTFKWFTNWEGNDSVQPLKQLIDVYPDLENYLNLKVKQYPINKTQFMAFIDGKMTSKMEHDALIDFMKLDNQLSNKDLTTLCDAYELYQKLSNANVPNDKRNHTVYTFLHQYFSTNEDMNIALKSNVNGSTHRSNLIYEELYSTLTDKHIACPNEIIDALFSNKDLTIHNQKSLNDKLNSYLNDIKNLIKANPNITQSINWNSNGNAFNHQGSDIAHAIELHVQQHYQCLLEYVVDSISNEYIHT